jgi:hypothetical protein
MTNMMGASARSRGTAIILFFALAGCYLSLSPGSIAGQGYTGEEIESGLRILQVSNAWIKGHPIPPMIWSRHGSLPVLFDLPFLKLGKRIVSPDFLLSFQPAIFTAALVAVLFLWLRKLCSPGMSLFLSLTAAVGTMLWPYAYISLETKQSLFVFLAGYLALGGDKVRTWPRLVLFAVVCAFAISVKSTGIVLWPVIAFLVFTQFRGEWRERRGRIVVLVLIIGAIWLFSHWTSNFFWGPQGGGASSLRPWLIDSPVQILGNIIGLLGSPTKGLLVYSPILIAAIYAVPQAYREHRDIVIYSLLVLGCTVGFLSLLTSPADEVWGCRYLHLTIAPLVLCIGAAWPRFTWRIASALVILAVAGVVVSFLGAFYYYGARNFAMQQAGQNTLEWSTGDGVWNPIQFNAKLFRIWLQDGGAAPVMWTPKHIWIWTQPPDAPAWKGINLRDYSEPQSFLVRFWKVPKTRTVLRIFIIYLGFLVIGILLLAWAILRTMKEEQAGGISETELSAPEVHAI